MLCAAVAVSRCRSFRSACRCHESTVAPFQIALDGASIASFSAVVGTGRPGHGLTGREARFNRQIFVSARWPFLTVLAIGMEIPLNRNAAAVRNGGASLHSPTIAEMTSSSLRVKVKKCGVVAQAGQTSARLKTATRGMPSGVRTDAGSLILRFNASRSRDEPRECRDSSIGSFAASANANGTTVQF